VTWIDFVQRWRVRAGYVVGAVVLWLSRPVPQTILVGAAIGIVGLAIRAWAAGYLRKQTVLTMTGPYARTRNPLYFGSSILTLGAAVAMNSWWSAAILLIYFGVVYSVVMRREEGELRAQHGAEFDAYSRQVPLFWPRLTAANAAGAVESNGSFSWEQFRKNHEHQATLGFLLLLLALVIIWRLHTA
jgi:protein-S-isoprenylcysteine O-methyltransferase Ste14